MNFEGALPLLRDGNVFTRKAWDDKNQRVTLKGNKLYKDIPCRVAHYKYTEIGYCPTSNDILATDWRMVQ